MDGAQFHMLSFLGSSWSRGEPRSAAARMAEITAGILRPGGVVTWDVPHGPTGRISDSFMRQFDAIGKAAAAVRR